MFIAVCLMRRLPGVAIVCHAALLAAACSGKAPAEVAPAQVAPAEVAPVSVPVAGVEARAPWPGPAPDAGTERRRITLATWNIEWLEGRPGEGKVPRRAADFDRLRRYAERLSADVVALQEVDGEESARRVFDAGTYVFHFTADRDNVQRTGFAVRRGIPFAANPDVAGLAVGGTRRGADITLKLPGSDLRLLSVHLKSGCWEERIAAGPDACGVLARQLPVLERWIDARARSGVPFAVLGDFNRRFEGGDAFWAGIDDGDPPGTRLIDAGRGHRSACWGGRFPLFVDHLVLGGKAASWIDPASFREAIFEPEDAPYRATLSDHCALVVALGISGTR